MSGGGGILTPLENVGELDRVLESPAALIYRHAPGRWQGFMAIGQVRRFALDHPELPVFVMPGRRDQPLADALVRRLGVPREAPQAILLRDGEAVWRATRTGVRYAGLETAVRTHG